LGDRGLGRGVNALNPPRRRVVGVGGAAACCGCGCGGGSFELSELGS
jgi:hypothetical protein